MNLETLFQLSATCYSQLQSSFPAELIWWLKKTTFVSERDILGRKKHWITLNGQGSARGELFSITVNFTMGVGFARDLKLLNAPDERLSRAAAKECKTCLNTFQHTGHMMHFELHLKCFCPELVHHTRGKSLHCVFITM